MKRLSVCCVVLLLALSALGTRAWADNSARIVRLSLVDGRVTMDRGDGQGDVSAIVNMPVVQGAAIRTGNDGYAELEFERGSTVRLTPGSSVQVEQLGREDNGVEFTALSVSGLVYFDLEKHEAATFRVTAGGQQITAPKEAHFRIDTTSSSGEIAVFGGEVRVTGEGSAEAVVKKDHTLSFAAGPGGEYEVAKDITHDATDRWDQERASYRDAYASRSSAYSGYSAAYRYGLGDLNYWGNYFYAPGWGWMWQPYNVGYGWNPFMNGAWAFYPSWGWTWVSSYPWGWTPYRYGNWMYLPSYGWCWQPTNTWSNWHAVPPVTAAPGSGAAVVSVRPTPPSHPPIAGAPSVLLVNSGPRWVDRSPGARPRLAVDDARGGVVRPGTRMGGPAVGPGAASRTGTNPATGVRPGTSSAPSRQYAPPRQYTPPRQYAPPRQMEPSRQMSPPRQWSPPASAPSAPPPASSRPAPK
jgi:hypothetical protein